MRGHRIGISKEEKVALTIGRLLSDFTLDLEAIGKYMAISNPHVIYARAIEVLEATEYNKTVDEYSQVGRYYSNNPFG